jgi:hypothetical protein
MLKKCYWMLKIQCKLTELQFELLLFTNPRPNLEKRKTLHLQDCTSLNTIIYKMHHLKCNPTIIMCFGTKIKSKVEPPLNNRLPQPPP